jgi:hypothetical protein
VTLNWQWRIVAELGVKKRHYVTLRQSLSLAHLSQYGSFSQIATKQKNTCNMLILNHM